MALGDLITRTNQIEYGGALIDATDEATATDAAADAVVPPTGIQGLRVPPRKRLSTPLVVGHGAFAGRDVWQPRKVTIKGLQTVDDEGLATLLAALWVNGPSNERELVWRGSGWPADRRFRTIARVDDVAETWDQDSALYAFDRPDITFEAGDPFAYEFAQQTAGPVAAGSSAVVSSAGTWETTRVRVTFTGPIVEPGISTSAVTGAAIRFAGLTLPDGETISLHFHRWTERFPTSSYFSPTQLGQAMFGGGPPASYAEPVWFPLVPGSQTLTHHGTGGGSMEVVWFDAHATPPVI